MTKKQKAEAPAVGSRWTNRRLAHGNVAKVLGVVADYVVYRHKNAMPALRHVNQWRDTFEPAIPMKPKRATGSAS